MIEKSKKPKKFNLMRLLTYILQAIIIGLLVLYFFQNRDVLSSLKNISLQQIVWIVLLDTTSFLIGSTINYSMYHRLEKRVSFLDCFMLQYVNNLFNKILPTIGGGAAFRAIYLKKKYQFSYSEFVSSLAGLYVISFGSYSLIGIVCLIIVYFQYNIFNWIIFLAFVGIFAPTLCIIVFSPSIPDSPNRLLKILKRIVDGWNIIKKDPKFIILYTFLSLLHLIPSALLISISYQALGIQTKLIPMLLLSTLGIILAFLNFTPDGIGIKEGIYIFSSKLVQIPDEILVLGSLILRGISFCTTFVIGGIFYWFLLKQLKTQAEDNTPIIHDQEPV
jgi:uncharacterized protein (TIRG00374 family)